MDEITIKALEYSIELWTNVAYNGASQTATNDACYMCNIYFDKDCVGCPATAVWGPKCENTPFYDWINYQVKNHKANREKTFKVFDEESKRLAIEILDAIKGFLP